jgi:hypothetical protein
MTLDNPIAVREWRTLRRRALDWRLWCGLEWTLDPLVWGLPAVLGFALAPYALCALVGLLQLFWPGTGWPRPGDLFALTAAALWFHVPAMSMVLAATAITQERERQTWEQVCMTRLTGRQRAAGILWGRLVPLWGSFLLTSAAWWLMHPWNVRQLDPVLPEALSRMELLAGAVLSLGMAAVAGYCGLMASSRAQDSRSAVIMGAVRLLLVFVLLAVAGPIAFVWSLFFGLQFAPLTGLGTVAVGLWFEWVCPSTWSSLEARLEQP